MCRELRWICELEWFIHDRPLYIIYQLTYQSVAYSFRLSEHVHGVDLD